jgi:5-formyltetrahydrofolate cyclo-ligase
MRVRDHLRPVEFGAVCLYKAVQNEPDVDRLADTYRGKKVFYPRISKRGLAFHLLQAGTRFIPGTFGIPEPDDESFTLADLGDGYRKTIVFVVPGVAFDRKCDRIGYGKGYYDAFFRSFAGDGSRNILKLGVTWDFLMYKTGIPSGPGDVAMDAVITDEHTYTAHQALFADTLLGR